MTCSCFSRALHRDVSRTAARPLYLEEQAAKVPLLKAKEESECFERICCPMFRSFTMDFRDGQGTTFFSIQRPFKCTIHTVCCQLCPQELTLRDALGRPAAHAREEFRCCWWCTRAFVAENERRGGKPSYVLFDLSSAHPASGCPFFALDTVLIARVESMTQAVEYVHIPPEVYCDSSTCSHVCVYAHG